MDTRDEFEELVAIYALGGLPDAERKRLEAHLQECSHCRELLAQERAIVQLLPRGLTPVEPSAAVKRNLLARVDADLAQDARPAAAPTPRPSTAPMTAPAVPPKRAWYTRPAFAFAALVIAVLLGLGLWYIVGNRPPTEQQQIAAIVADPNAHTVALKGTPDAPGAAGELVMVPGQNQAVLRVSGLEQLPEDKRYEFWFIRGDELQPSNLFSVNPDGSTVVLVQAKEPVQTFTNWGVSVEPKQGVTKPTGPIVILGGS